MSDKEAINASSRKDSLDKESEYNGNGNIVKKGEEPKSSAPEEEEEEDDCVKEETNLYMALCAQQIAQNCKCLIALGLATKSGKKKTITSQLQSRKKRSATAATPPCTSVSSNVST